MIRNRTRGEKRFAARLANLDAHGACFLDGGDSEAPDYTEMAAANKYAAEVAERLGNAQIAESTRQYEKNMEIAAPIVEEQLGMMKDSREQGNDYYNYMKENQRPVEGALNAEAMAAGSDAKQQEGADRAEADSMRGFTKASNITARQAARYGFSPDKMKRTADDMSASLASGIASAASSAREKEKATGYAKKMDVAGLYRNLTGASQGSYGLAISAGNSANANNMAPGQALLGGMAQGANMIQTGAGQAIQGNAAIINSQTSMANAGQAGAGQMIGAVGGIAVAI